MNTATAYPHGKRKRNRNRSQLYIVFGDLHHKSEKETRINSFWTFCHAAFWPTQNFTPQQEQYFKSLIREHFALAGDCDQTFVELVERAILAKRYVKRWPGRFMPAPSEWLNIRYAKGLTGTASWYSELQLQRLIEPEYNKGVSILAHAVLQFVKAKGKAEVASFRQKLIELEHIDLLFIYTNFIVHSQYLNH